MIPGVADEVRGILMEPPTDELYENLKLAILKRTADSGWVCFRELGNLGPTQLHRRMRQLTERSRSKARTLIFWNHCFFKDYLQMSNRRLQLLVRTILWTVWPAMRKKWWRQQESFIKCSLFSQPHWHQLWRSNFTYERAFIPNTLKTRCRSCGRRYHPRRNRLRSSSRGLSFYHHWQWRL